MASFPVSRPLGPDATRFRHVPPDGTLLPFAALAVIPIPGSASSWFSLRVVAAQGKMPSSAAMPEYIYRI